MFHHLLCHDSCYSHDNNRRIVIGVLLLFHIEYETYEAGGIYLNYLLTPATVCLAVPLYKQIHLLKQYGFAIVLSVSEHVQHPFSDHISDYASNDDDSNRDVHNSANLLTHTHSDRRRDRLR